MTRPRQQGFTLIELMVVIAIVGILVVLALNFSAQTQGANAQTVSEQVVSQMQYARSRAVSTRRYHRVEIVNDNTGPTLKTKIILWEGMTGAAGTGSPSTGMIAPVSYREVQEIKLPVKVVVADASHTVYPTSGTAVTTNPALDFFLTIKPDGSTDGMTAFLGDQNTSRQERIVVYTVTGSAYARQIW